MTNEDHKLVQDILVVIVLYKTQLIESQSFITVNNILKKENRIISVLVYDNSPVAQYDENNFIILNSEITYIHNPDNPGVSKAYNTASVLAINGKKWLLLLDSDTQLSFVYWNLMQKAVYEHPSINLFVPKLVSVNKVISPCRFFTNNGFILKKRLSGITKCSGKAILNSGTLISVSEYQHLGGYDERVPLYYSDYVFFEKYKNKNKFFYVIDVNIEHSLSEDTSVLLPKAKQTYKLNCLGAKQAIPILKHGYTLYFWLLYKCFRFIVKYKEISFLKIYYNNLF